MPRVILLGDSIFDNAAYVAGGPDVATQLRAILPPGWDARLNADEFQEKLLGSQSVCQVAGFAPGQSLRRRVIVLR